MGACPECGSGIVSRDAHGVTIRLPRGYPNDPPCRTCKRKGREAAEDVERRAMESMTR